MRARLICVALAALWLCVPAPAHAQLPVKYLSKARLGVRCFETANTNAALDCWLVYHPDVAGAMFYQDSVFTGTWPTWPSAAKSQLHVLFDQMVAWYHAGMPAAYPKQYPIPIPPGGPPQQPTPSPPGADEFWMTEAMGKRVYLSHLANSLAAELTAAYPWTITQYTPSELTLLLSMNDMMFYGSNAPHPGYFIQYDEPSPATPGFTVTFFKHHNLIGTDAKDTVGRLFAWERNLTHDYVVAGDPNPNIFPYFWGPNSPPVPDSMVITGTVYSGPSTPLFGHFTAGCSGTQYFMKSVLRSVNIPVQLNWVTCTHATPIFPTLDLAMTHGDDPYDSLGLVSPYPGFSTPAPLEYFVSINELNQLFPASQSWDACTQTVGIQVANIAIKYGSDSLMNLYCQDLASQADHASGQVYGYMKWYYPLQTLENMGLWTTLDAKVTATNFCGM